jgi:hypothetical protein
MPSLLVHAALTAGVTEGDLVVVLGSGTLGLLTLAALRRWTRAGTLVAVAKHPHQQALARQRNQPKLLAERPLGRPLWPGRELAPKTSACVLAVNSVPNSTDDDERSQPVACNAGAQSEIMAWPCAPSLQPSR